MSTSPSNPRVEFLVATMKAGRRGVFIDDGGGAHKLPPDVLVKDFLLYVAVVVESAELEALDRGHSQWLAAAQVDAPLVSELHCNEISFGKKAWATVPPARRAFHLQQACEKLLPTIGRIVYAYIGKEQYEELLARAKSMAPVNDRYSTQKTGLAFSFYKALASHLSESTQEAVVLHDQGLQKEWDQEIIFADSVPVYEKSIIHVRSDLFAGVQLADLVAWTFNRAFRVSGQLRRGEPISDIDQVVWEAFPKMWAKTINIWNDTTDLDENDSIPSEDPGQE